jgi:RNA polymerase sigma factor (sigma-70 family)
MDIPDGDLVRLARDGDQAAFRLLVERYLPMARARAARLCPQPDDADDAVQDAFLQAFLALDRLRDPDRFAGWLGGIVANVCRAQRRRAPLTLFGDWPENLHPASAGSLPSAEDLDRADVLGRAVAGLPPGQRHAVTAFYYADQPAGQVAGTPGAAKASLHKARRRLREYITAHRPDLIPDLSRRIPVTAVRIAHADPWPGRTPDGRMAIDHVLVILADDAGHRALPVRLPGPERQLWRLLSRPDDRDEDQWDAQAEEMTGRRPRRAGTPRRQPGPAPATAGSQPGSRGRPGQPHRLRHRNRRVDPVRGHRPDPGGRQLDQVRRLPERRRPARTPPPGTSAPSARPAVRRPVSSGPASA